MKVMVKKVGCPLEVVETNEQYFGNCVKSFLGENITVERVYMGGEKPFEFIMGVDEDGLPKKLPFNFFMDINNLYSPIQPIVGTAVFVRCKPCNPYEEDIWDYEVDDMTDRDKGIVEHLLSYENQYRLYLDYKENDR